MKKLLLTVLALSLVLGLSSCMLPQQPAGNTSGSSGEAGGTGSLIMTIGMLVAMVAVFYFLIIRPQKKQEKETRQMLDALSVGDTISTVGGIIGVVLKIKDDMVLIETGADRSRIQIAKWAVRKVEEKAND